jgi:nucleotide-binding universal stress UspA family protein
LAGTVVSLLVASVHHDVETRRVTMTSYSERLRSILVPLDGSTVAEQALPIAVAIAERARCKIKLVLVHQPLLGVEPTPADTRMELAMEKANRDYLRSVVTRYRERLARTLSSAVLEGPVAATLARYGRELSADLIVMTSHGRGRLRRAWLGSVADQLIRTSEVPILVVRARDQDRTPSVDLGEIMVPLDGSPLAEAVLEPVTALARLWDAEISLVQVVLPVILTGDPLLPFPNGYSDEIMNMRREAAQDYIQDVAERLREAGVRASGVAVIGGAVGETLLDLAQPDRVSLIATATHGRGGVRRLVLGSVADKLVRGAQVPVLVVRPSGKNARRGSRRTESAVAQTS